MRFKSDARLAGRIQSALLPVGLCLLFLGCFPNQDAPKTVGELNRQVEKSLAQSEKAIAEVEARNQAAAQTLIDQDKLDEQHASSFLTAAKDFQEKGRLKHAVEIFKEVVDQYPETKAAAEAAKILEGIEQEKAGEEQ